MLTTVMILNQKDPLRSLTMVARYLLDTRRHVVLCCCFSSLCLTFHLRHLSAGQFDSRKITVQHPVWHVFHMVVEIVCSIYF